MEQQRCKSLLKLFGTYCFLIKVLLQLVSILSTCVGLTCSDPVRFLIKAVTSVVKSNTQNLYSYFFCLMQMSHFVCQ
jgi:hypothetical protein